MQTQNGLSITRNHNNHRNHNNNKLLHFFLFAQYKQKGRQKVLSAILPFFNVNK